MKMKLRFLAMGAILFLLGAGLGEARGFGTGYYLLMGIGVVLLVLGLFWQDRPSAQAAGPTGS